MSVKWWLLAQGVTITTGSNDIIKFKDGGGVARTATVAAGTYYLDGGGDASDLLLAVTAALTAAPSMAGTITGTFAGKTTTGGVTGTVSLLTNQASVQLIDSGSTFDFTLLGFAQADSAAADPLTASLSSTVTWCGDQPAIERDPSEDKSYVYESRTPSGKVDVNQYGDDQELMSLVFEYIEGPRVVSNLASDESDPARAFQAWRRIAKLGAPIRLYLLADSSGVLGTASASDLAGTYTLTGSILTTFRMRRTANAANARDFGFTLHPYVG